MSNLFEDTPQKELSWLLRQIAEKEVALPDFQRDFVWDPSATQELIVSVANNYPAGSLLAIRNSDSSSSGSTYFAAREFAGAPELKKHRPEYLILDGQQRLTSLFQAFYGVGEHRYFVDLRKLLDGEDFEDSIFHVRSSAKRGKHARILKKYETLEGQASDLVVPLRVLFGEKDGFQGWARKVARSVADRDERDRLEDDLDSIKDRFINKIELYRFPVVLLSDETPADAVCTIFETLNRTGVRLSVFDLLAARFWPENVRLRDLWEHALEKHSIIEDFQIDPYYVLQSLALVRHEKAPSCKRKDVLKLASKDVVEVWNSVVTGLAKSLEILRDDCGVLIHRWVPYNTIVIPLTAILAKSNDTTGLDRGAVRQKVVRWYWCSIFGQAYEHAPNSQAAKDMVEVSSWINGGEPPQTVREFAFEKHSLFDVTPRQRALYRGAITLVLSQNPRDFHSLDPLNRALITTNNVDDHHIFPDAHLRESGVESAKRRDCILNRTLIDRNTNQSLGKTSPSRYFGGMRERIGEPKFGQLLESHLLPTEPLSSLLTDDYDAFLNWRQEKLYAKIVSVTSA